MHAVSLAADALGLRALKGAMLYLQMSLYGIAEGCLVDAFAPGCLISDRHALVDTLAYGPVYGAMLGAELDGAHWDPIVREQLAAATPHALDATMAWHASLARRLGQTTGFWELPHEVASIFERSPAEVLGEFSRRYGTTLPDAVAFLQIDPAEALRRSAGRTRPLSELHENAATLESLRALYDRALDTLERGHPEIALHRLEVSSLSLDETVDAVLGCLPARVAPGMRAG
jgi:hypothetical protein